MPKENKLRGRRAEKKRKQEEEFDNDISEKRQRYEPNPYEDITWDDNANYLPLGEPELPDQVFYGLLDDEEQEYFRKVGEMLELNQFESPADRQAFVQSVYQEAANKELKLANSQSCSRVLERLIQCSTPDQLRGLFQTFTGHFATLFQHRFASHCCEALFLQSTPLIKPEIFSEGPKFEDLFIVVINEIEEQLGFLITHVFGSHPLRILLLVLAGEPIQQRNNKNILHSRRKENISTLGEYEAHHTLLLESRQVPSSFDQALKTVIYKSVASLDTNSLRSLTTHPVGNPILQLLLRLELTKYGKQSAMPENSIMHTLLPDVNLQSETGAYIQSMIYDSIGSRLLEVIIEFAPSKIFRIMYKSFFAEKFVQLCRGDTSSYVVCKVLNRIGADNLKRAITSLGPEFPLLIELSRLNVIRTLIDRAIVRQIPLAPLVGFIKTAFAGSDGTFDITKLIPEPILLEDNTQPRLKDPKAIHASLLAKSLLAAPAPLSQQCITSLASQPSNTLLAYAKSTTHAPILTAFCSFSTHATKAQRRQLIAILSGHYAELALDWSGSTVIIAFWDGTRDLPFLRERIATDLAGIEPELRSSKSGRNVWKAWEMDLYVRRRGEWIRHSKDDDKKDETVAGNLETEFGHEKRFAKLQLKQTGANSIAIKGDEVQPIKQMRALEKARAKHFARKMAGQK